jgi:hypothetical protein
MIDAERVKVEAARLQRRAEEAALLEQVSQPN